MHLDSLTSSKFQSPEGSLVDKETNTVLLVKLSGADTYNEIMLYNIYMS